MKALWFTLLLLPATAWAQSTDEEIVDDAGRTHKVKYRERDEVDFEKGLELEGELAKPSVVAVGEHRRPTFNPLIHLRSDWAAEMPASVDEVK